MVTCLIDRDGVGGRGGWGLGRRGWGGGSGEGEDPKEFIGAFDCSLERGERDEPSGDVY